MAARLGEGFPAGLRRIRGRGRRRRRSRHRPVRGRSAGGILRRLQRIPLQRPGTAAGQLSAGGGALRALLWTVALGAAFVGDLKGEPRPRKRRPVVIPANAGSDFLTARRPIVSWASGKKA